MVLSSPVRRPLCNLAAGCNIRILNDQLSPSLRFPPPTGWKFSANGDADAGFAAIARALATAKMLSGVAALEEERCRPAVTLEPSVMSAAGSLRRCAVDADLARNGNAAFSFDASDPLAGDGKILSLGGRIDRQQRRRRSESSSHYRAKGTGRAGNFDSGNKEPARPT